MTYRLILGMLELLTIVMFIVAFCFQVKTRPMSLLSFICSLVIFLCYFGLNECGILGVAQFLTGPHGCGEIVVFTNDKYLYLVCFSGSIFSSWVLIRIKNHITSKVLAVSNMLLDGSTYIQAIHIFNFNYNESGPGGPGAALAFGYGGAHSRLRGGNVTCYGG